MCVSGFWVQFRKALLLHTDYFGQIVPLASVLFAKQTNNMEKSKHKIITFKIYMLVASICYLIVGLAKQGHMHLLFLLLLQKYGMRIRFLPLYLFLVSLRHDDGNGRQTPNVLEICQKYIFLKLLVD